MQKGPDAMTADCCLCVSQKVAFSEGNQKQTYKLQLYDKAAFFPPSTLANIASSN